MNSASSAAVEKIQRCHLSQRQLCLINPRTGAKTEIVVKQFGKAGTRLYNIDIWRLIEVADTYQGRR